MGVRPNMQRAVSDPAGSAGCQGPAKNFLTFGQKIYTMAIATLREIRYNGTDNRIVYPDRKNWDSGYK